MQTITILPGQSLLDIALQYCGSPDLAPDIVTANKDNVPLTLDYVADKPVTLKVPDPSNAIPTHLRNHACQPCTGDLDHAAPYTFQGIAYETVGQMPVEA